MAIKMSDLRDELRETRERAELAERHAESMVRTMVSDSVRNNRLQSENALLREFVRKVSGWGFGGLTAELCELEDQVSTAAAGAYELLQRLGDGNKTKEGAE